MAKWSGLLPVAMWASGVGVPAHALQVSGSLLQATGAPQAHDACRDPFAYPSAPQGLPCWPDATLVPEATRTDPGTALTAVAVTLASAAEAPPLGDPVPEAVLDAARAEDRRGWPTRLLAGLVTVGMVVHRRLAWRARGMALCATASARPVRPSPYPPSDSPPTARRPDQDAAHAARTAPHGA